MLLVDATFAQKKMHFIFHENIKDREVISKIKLPATCSDSISCSKEIILLIEKFKSAGFLEISVDSVLNDTSDYFCYLNSGPLYQWVKLSKGNVEPEMLGKIGFAERNFQEKAFSMDEVNQLQEKLLLYCENNAYPFASVYLDSIKIETGKVSAALGLEKNRYCQVDSFQVKGNAKIATSYMQRQLGIRKGDAYDESKVLAISKRINEVPFLTESAPAQLYFSEKYTKLTVFVAERKANRFDGILGFMPNETTGKLLITGQVTLRLLNSFNRGEALDVDWQKLQARTQNLKARLQLPFLFRSPFGADLGFKLYKRDTLFTDVSENIGINYLIGINNYLKVFFNNRNIALISTRGMENLTTLPTMLDVNSKLYGIGFRAEKLDYKFNPRKGFSFDMNASAGTKTVKRNTKLNPKVYDNLKQLKTNVYLIDLMAELFIPIQNRSVIVFGNRSAWMQSENIFANELFRIGGMATLRGFDEESINASAYTITKVEYRFLLEQNSFLAAFANHAYYENTTISGLNDQPIGAGVGINFETKPGIFSLSYALGKQFNNPISLRSAKVHFGIVSTF